MAIPMVFQSVLAVGPKQFVSQIRWLKADLVGRSFSPDINTLAPRSFRLRGSEKCHLQETVSTRDPHSERSSST